MKGYKIDIKTGKQEFVVDDEPFPEYPTTEEPEPVNLEDLRKLIQYAKQKGWIT